jgi:hypothetical protein
MHRTSDELSKDVTNAKHRVENLDTVYVLHINLSRSFRFSLEIVSTKHNLISVLQSIV